MSKAFGEQNPTQGEDPVSWQTFSDGAGSVPTIVGNADWGKLHLTSGEEGRSAVYDHGSAVNRTYTLTENRYGTGSGDPTLQIRGDTVSFNQDDASPSWETYLAPVVRNWRYVQVREILNPFLGVSDDGRYLIESTGMPWLLIGDSPQGMMVRLSSSDMATYMADRSVRGINAIQVELFGGTVYDGNDTTYETYDGVKPFSTNQDLSTPNETYFARVDAMLNLAASYGMTVFLNAAPCFDDKTLPLFKNNGAAKCLAFGQYLGNRYKNFPNIVWAIGNDFQVWDSDSTAETCILAVADGIFDNDTNHLLTAWLNYLLSASRDSTDWDSRIDIDFSYSYYPNYDNILDEYALSPAKPVFLGETNYEGESSQGYLTTPFVIRKQNYWTMLSGGCGLFYCNGPDTYKFASGWASRLTTDGVVSVTHLKNLLEAYSWWQMIPDNAHAILTAGYGTYADGTDGSINTNDYAPCAYVAGVSLAMIYMPSNRTMTVDMSQFSGMVTCRWYDPTDGSYTADAASPHTNSGTHDFSRAGANALGDHDWVLVLST